jgi:O-acetyl-ADP-ribose deacetylase (regulator of RNase III)
LPSDAIGITSDFKKGSAVIRYVQGDILDADAEALVNTVNSVGVMGRGIALQFKRAYPANFKAYAAACRRGEVRPGRMFVFDTGELTNPRYIINFPTKVHWRGRAGSSTSNRVSMRSSRRSRRARSSRSRFRRSAVVSAG